MIKRALERMDAMLSETDADGTPVAFNKAAGFVVVGNEDGAHHCIAEMAGAAIDSGFTVPRAGLDVLEQGSRPWARRSIAPPTIASGPTRTGDAMVHVLVHTRAHSRRRRSRRRRTREPMPRVSWM